MRSYYSVFKIRLMIGMQYRIAAFAGIITQFFWGFMSIMVFEAFYLSSAKTPSISLEQIVTYIWLQQAFLNLIMLWFRDNEIFDNITSGNIAYELCRPCNLYGFWYSKILGQRLSGAMLRCLPVLVIAYFLPGPYNLSLPYSFTTCILFIITLTLGLFILVAISMLIYISVFKTMSPAGSLLVFALIGEFFSGMTIPIPLMPQWLQNISNILPFRLAVDLPFRVYSNHIPIMGALEAIAIQVLWLGILIVGGNQLMKRVLRNIVIQGG